MVVEWENHSKIMGKWWLNGKNHSKTMGKWWLNGKTRAKSWENGDLMGFHGGSMEKKLKPMILGKFPINLEVDRGKKTYVMSFFLLQMFPAFPGFWCWLPIFGSQ